MAAWTKTFLQKCNFQQMVIQIEKLRSDGSLGTCCKARLAARGFSQVGGVDFSETYSPVVNFTSIPTVLVIVTNFQLNLHQVDVVAAFLNGKLDLEVYVEKSEGY